MDSAYFKEQLIARLVGEGYLKSPALISAFRKIDRGDFVPEALRDQAYLNQPLPIGFNQTISQPLTVAFMLELLSPQPKDKILEIGAGSGWQTALLGFIAQTAKNKPAVVSIEILPELISRAKTNIAKYNYINKGIVKLVEGDGSKGYPPEAPYDKIIAAASAKQIPENWIQQLKEGGKIVAPVKTSIMVLTKLKNSRIKTEEYPGFLFVPLIDNGKR